MIKTVSFAPPRGSGSRGGARAAGAKVVPVESLRPQSARPASGRTPKAAPAQTSLELLFDAPEPVAAPPIESPAIALAPLPKIKVARAPKTSPIVPEVAATDFEITEKPAPVSSPISAPAPINAVKAKKPRAPKDLAAQYGEKVVERVVAPPIEVEAPKKRLNKVERQARRDLIKPSDDLMARLARANEIAARKPKAEPRGKGWKFQCGRCGTTSYFETPGGLCSCGTIAVKE